MVKILCVDDDKDILDTCEVILNEKGYKTFTAFNGKEGLEKALELKPELIIMDVMMDDFTDGFTAVQKIRKEESLKYTPILMLTSVNQHFPQKFGEKDGEYLPVDSFMEKPLKPTDFLNKIAELLALKKEDINVEGKK
jgi:two-component system, OmpR family, alkaline phosphatase synthesis response regulator PhoP